MLSRNVSDVRSLRTFPTAIPYAGSRGFLTHVAYRATADVVSKGVTLVITVAAARVLPAADFGVLALAMTTGWILSVASDAGIPLFLAKLMAQDVAAGTPPSFATVSRVMRVRVATGVVAAFGGLAIAMTIASRELVAAFALIVVAQLLGAVLETLAHAYRGVGRSQIESSVMLAQRSVTAIAVIATLMVRPSLWWLSLAMAIPPALALVVSLALARRIFARGSTSERDAMRLTWPRFATEAGPLGAAILLSALYFRCDVYFVERWHGLDVVGVYNAAFRIAEALRLLPAAVLAVSFPALCVAEDSGLLKRLGIALAGIGIVLGVLLYASAPAVLNALYGARFVDAARALQILALALPLFFVNYALTHQVIAWDGQRSYLTITAAALIANLGLNALLIPTGAMVGAAVSTLMTELVVMAGCLGALRHHGRTPALAGSLS